MIGKSRRHGHEQPHPHQQLRCVPVCVDFRLVVMKKQIKFLPAEVSPGLGVGVGGGRRLCFPGTNVPNHLGFNTFPHRFPTCYNTFQLKLSYMHQYEYQLVALLD